MPTSPRLATLNPITAPPLNAMRSACPWPCARAASLVRTLARVADSMPASPARMEQRPPAMYATAVRGVIAHPSRTATITRKGRRIVYSRRRKVIAPVWIMSARSRIAAEPSGSRRIVK